MKRMSRSGALVPILIVIVLAFFAQRIISPSTEEDKPTYTEFIAQINAADAARSRHRVGDDEDERQHDRRRRDRRHRVLDRLPGQHRGAAGQHARAAGHRDRRRRQGRLVVPRPAHLHPSLRPDLRLLDLPDEPDAGRRLAGHELRQVEGQADVRRRAQDHLPRRRRRRRGRPGAPRDQGVPREPEEVPGARRPDPEGRAALRASRAPARPCSRAPSPARRACRSSRSPARTSSRCSSASAPAASATSSSRPSRTPPASSSWTRSTPSAAIAAPAWAAVTTSASRP